MHSDRPVLEPFELWADRAARFDLFDLPGEEARLRANRDALRSEAKAYAREFATRDDPHAATRVLKAINGHIRASYHRKRVALLNLEEAMVGAETEKLDYAEALKALTEANA